MILDEQVLAGAAFLALAEIKTPNGMNRLGSPANNDEFARTLYATFRLADKKGFTTLIVRKPEGDGVAVAIRERLAKAAQGR